LVTSCALAVLFSAGNPVAVAAPPVSHTKTETPSRTIAVVVNGEPLVTEAPPQVIAGRVFVPLRSILGALGLSIERSGSTLSAQLPSGTFVAHIGSSQATIDGHSVDLGGELYESRSTTFAPLRFLEVVFGAQTSYDQRGAKVEIFSAFVGKNADGRQSAASGGTVLTGIVSAVDRNSSPPEVTILLNGVVRSISLNSSAKIYIEDASIHSQTSGTLADVRVGDALRAVLDKNGSVVEVHDFFKSTSGPVSAVSGSSIVLSTGKVVTPGRETEITLSDAPAVIGDIHVGDYVTVRSNPESGELRQIIASRKTIAPASSSASASAVTISSFTISAARTLRAGEFFDVQMIGTPGGKATFDIGEYVSGVQMREDAPGTYRSRYTIPDRFNVTQVPVYGHLSVGGSDAPRAEAATQLSSSTTPPTVTDYAPRPGRTVNNPRPNIYATFSSPGDSGINTSSVALSVNGRDVTASATRTATFITYSPGVDYPDGEVVVVVRVSDNAGNTATKSWSFFIKAR
jgi:hypothetical protein